MLLRRITEHVKAQNWTAVALDFVIVVVGVFIGIQVANWNDARAELRDESGILNRLYEETAVLMEVNAIEHHRLKERTDSLVSAHPVLFSEVASRPLTQKECETIAGSHVFRRASDDIPVLDELMETGRFNLLRDDQLRAQLRGYILFRERQRANHDERTNELFRLYSRHPKALSVSRMPVEAAHNSSWTWLSGDGYRWDVTCDVEEMRASKSFLNEYFDNSARHGQVLLAYNERTEFLISLNESLGALLGKLAEKGKAE